MQTRRFFPALLISTALGCAPLSDELDGAEDETSNDQAVQGPDTATTLAQGNETTLNVVAGNLKLTMQPTWKPVVRGGQAYWRATGSSSKNLDNIFSFVFDDAFGEATLLTKRKFEVLIPEGGSEMNTILAGHALYLQINPSIGATSYTGRMITGPALTDFDGTTALTIDRLIRPVYVEDGVTNLLYRGTATTKTVYDDLAITSDADADPVVHRGSPKSFMFDWTFQGVYTAAHDPGLTFTLSRGQLTRTKEAEIEIGLRSLALTVLDPYDTWGGRTCDPNVLACIQQKPVGTTDFGDCGVYYDVQICKIQNP